MLIEQKSPGTNSYGEKLKYLYFSLFAVIAGVLSVAAFSEGSEPGNESNGNDKIIKFSHSFHAELTDCASCHSKAAASTSLKDLSTGQAGRLMPNHDDCATCHDVENTDQCSTCHYDDINEP